MSEDFDLDEFDLDDFDFEVESEPEPKPKPKKAKAKKRKKKVKVTNEKKEELEAFIEEETTLPVRESPDFDPVSAGEELKRLKEDFSRVFVERAAAIGRILERASSHFKRDRDGFESWLRENGGMSYSTARFYIQVAQIPEDLQGRIVEIGFDNMDLKSLVTLKPPLLEEFLEQESVEIDGDEVEIHELEPKQLNKAVREFKKEKGQKVRRERSEVEVFDAWLNHINTFVIKHWDDFRDYAKGRIKKGEVTDDLKKKIEQIKGKLDKLQSTYERMMKRLGI